MMLVVTGVGFLIHIYAVGYMAHEGGYYRFFSYLNLFMFFMLTLVLANNYLLMFVGWEGVGLASYLLIGFFFTQGFRRQRGQESVHHQPRRRLRIPDRALPAHSALRHAAIRRSLRHR
jgi:NADH-quinone oxidoreductase subunit L